MPKLDLATIHCTNSTSYPSPHSDAVSGRWNTRLAPVAGLADFGASHVTLKPGAWSSQRHWHEEEDELVVILSGEAVLVDDNGRTPLSAGDIAAFPKNDGNGHHLINEADVDCVFVAIGRSPAGLCHYPDIDMRYTAADGFTHKDGSPF